MRAIYRKRLRALGEFVAVGVVVGALVGELIHQMDGGAVGPYVVRGVAVGVLIGCLLGVGEELLFVGIGRGLSYAGLNTSLHGGHHRELGRREFGIPVAD